VVRLIEAKTNNKKVTRNRVLSNMNRATEVEPTSRKIDQIIAEREQVNIDPRIIRNKL